MSNELTNWFDGFAKTAEASGITDPADIQKLIAFHKRAELAAKHPAKFEAGFNAAVKQAQIAAPPTTLYNNPQGFSSEDITPDVGHHALNYGMGGAAVGGTIGGLLRKMTGGAGHTAAPLATGALGPLGGTVGRFITSLGRNPHGTNIGILGALLGAMYGAGKGHFMTGRYGTGSNVGTTPEGYLNKMAPEIDRMKAIRSRLSGALGPDSSRLSSSDWYQSTHPQ